MQNNTDELIEHMEFLEDFMLKIYKPEDEIVKSVDKVLILLKNKFREINNLN